MTPAERRDIPASDRRSQQLLAAIFRATLRALMKPMFHPRVPTSLLRAGMRTLTTTTLRAAGICTVAPIVSVARPPIARLRLISRAVVAQRSLPSITG